MTISLALIIDWLLQYRYLVLFPIMIFEGPIVTIIAGFLSSLGFFNFFIIWPVLVGADLIGDLIFYAIGMYGRERFILRWGKYIGINAERILKLESYFDKHTRKTLLFGKLSHGIGAPVLISAGIVRVKIWEFIWINFIATLFKILILLLIGFYFGQAYVKIDRFLDYFAIGLGVVAVLVLIIFFSYKKIRQRYDSFLEGLSKL